MPRKYEIRACSIHGADKIQGGHCREVVERTKTHVRYCHRQEPVTAVDLRDVEPLVAALKEAVEMVEEWSGYAPAYFREKHDLEGDLAKLRSALKAFEEDS